MQSRLNTEVSAVDHKMLNKMLAVVVYVETVVVLALCYLDSPAQPVTTMHAIVAMLAVVTALVTWRVQEEDPSASIPVITAQLAAAFLIMLSNHAIIDSPYVLLISTAIVALYRQRQLVAVSSIFVVVGQVVLNSVQASHPGMWPGTDLHKQLADAVWLAINGGLLALLCDQGPLSESSTMAQPAVASASTQTDESFERVPEQDPEDLALLAAEEGRRVPLEELLASASHPVLQIIKNTSETQKPRLSQELPLPAYQRSLLTEEARPPVEQRATPLQTTVASAPRAESGARTDAIALGAPSEEPIALAAATTPAPNAIALGAPSAQPIALAAAAPDAIALRAPAAEPIALAAAAPVPDAIALGAPSAEPIALAAAAPVPDAIALGAPTAEPIALAAATVPDAIALGAPTAEPIALAAATPAPEAIALAAPTAEPIALAAATPAPEAIALAAPSAEPVALAAAAPVPEAIALAAPSAEPVALAAATPVPEAIALAAPSAEPVALATTAPAPDIALAAPSAEPIALAATEPAAANAGEPIALAAPLAIVLTGESPAAKASPSRAEQISQMRRSSRAANEKVQADQARLEQTSSGPHAHALDAGSTKPAEQPESSGLSQQELLAQELLRTGGKSLSGKISRTSSRPEARAGEPPRQAQEPIAVRTESQSNTNIITQQAIELGSLVQRMAKTIANLDGPVRRMLQSIGGADRSMQEIRDEVARTAASVIQVTRGSEMHAEKARSVFTAADQAASVSEIGALSTTQTIQNMARIHEQMDLISRRMDVLLEKIKLMIKVVGFADELALQSKILSVNAAIEAAKAGDRGHGFAAVAREVKSLANQSKDATRQVRTILKEIQQSVAEVRRSLTLGKETVALASDQCRSTAESIKGLDTNVNHSRDAAEAIMQSSKDQLQGMMLIARAMNDIQSVSDQNFGSIGNLQVEGRNLHSTVRELVTEIGLCNDLIKKMLQSR